MTAPDELVLDSLVVKDFRSIRGEVVVPVNAPVVLIHGPNGTGKSSLMTALALALGGSHITGVADPKHLVHHGADHAAITLGTSHGPSALRIAPEDDGIGPGALEAKDATFFAERCYLEQTKLTRLLQIYQETAKSGAESALTRFVKELLRLDEIDALVDGLHVAGDVRRVEGKLPNFKAARAAKPALRERLAQIERDQQKSRVTLAELELSMTAALRQLGLTAIALDDAAVEWALDERLDSEKLSRVERFVLRAEDLERRRTELDSAGVATTAGDAEARLVAAQERQDRWHASHGQALDAVIVSLRSHFPRLPSMESVTPSEVYEQAIESVDAELGRLGGALANDDRTLTAMRAAEQAIEEAQTRLEVLDREIADESVLGSLGDLARILSDLTPHIANDACPVCSRDFSEISSEPLSAHLAAEISRLSARAGQLQSAARARLETTTDLRRAEQESTRLAAERLSFERRASEEERLAALSVLRKQLHEHEQGAREGGAVMRDVVAADGALSEALRRDHSFALWREEFEQLSTQLVDVIDVDGPIEEVADMSAALVRQRAALTARCAQREAVARTWDELREQRTTAQALTDERAQLEGERDDAARAVKAVTKRMEDARALRQRVEAIRRSSIASVFNSALNSVWADLFVRLAPDEEYVPAFAAPSPSGPVKVRLETRRTDGTPGGTPEEMLSAGNLNTAALTLFLALHLSVRRRVPWLLLDDPVQSMDEIHVAQFAALLRTLTQRDPQRRVVIAVHERALFEYFALELSPASKAGGLVTVELRRDRAGGDSTAVPMSRGYEPDVALSAA